MRHTHHKRRHPISPPPTDEAKEAEAEEAEREHLEEEEEGYQEPARDQEEADAKAPKEEADWAGLYEDPANYNAQRWTPVPPELFVERNTSDKFQRPPGVLPIYQRGVMMLPERPHSPFAVLTPESVRYVFF
jgi:hypothetical protein